MSTRSVVAAAGQGRDEAVGPPHDAGKNVPRNTNTQTQVSGGVWLELDTSP
jgi:hypothetical protein